MYTRLDCMADQLDSPQNSHTGKSRTLGTSLRSPQNETRYEERVGIIGHRHVLAVSVARQSQGPSDSLTRDTRAYARCASYEDLVSPAPLRPRPPPNEWRWMSGGRHPPPHRLALVRGGSGPPPPMGALGLDVHPPPQNHLRRLQSRAGLPPARAPSVTDTTVRRTVYDTYIFPTNVMLRLDIYLRTTLTRGARGVR